MTPQKNQLPEGPAVTGRILRSQSRNADGAPAFTRHNQDSIAARAFVRQVARLQNESETPGGFTWEDGAASLNSLIRKARAVTRIDPGHAKIYCTECQLPSKECGCEDEQKA